MILTHLFGELDDKSFDLPSKQVLLLFVVFLLSSQFSYSLPDRICYPLSGGTVCINSSTVFGGVDTDTWWSLTGLYLFNNSGSLDFNESKLNATITALATGTTDGNNYTNNITVTGTTTKNISIGIIGRPNIWATFTDIDTDTDTDTWWSLAGSAYLYNCTGVLCLNETKLNNTILGLTNQYYNYSSVISGIQSNVSNVNITANSKALPGSCVGQVVSATTVSGVTCVDYVNKTTTDGLYQSGVEQNNYTTSIGFNGSVTKQLNIAINGRTNLTATFTDIDTNTGNCSVDQSCSGILYDSNASNFYSSSNPLQFLNLTNITALGYQTGSEIGNCSVDQSCPNILYDTNASNFYSSSNSLQFLNLTNITALGYATTAYVTSIGNWSLDKPSYVSQTYGNNTYGLLSVLNSLIGNVSSIGNWSQDKSAIQANITNVNATANTKAMTGTASCTGSQLLQNVTLTSTGSPIANCTTVTATGDGNNYTVSVVVTGTSTKSINFEIVGRPSINATFTDIDTDTWVTDKAGIQANITNVNTTANSKINSSTIALYTLLSYTQSIGNWSLDKPSYLTTSAFDTSQGVQNTSLNNEISARQSLGNWSADKSGIQANITNVNMTANTKALPGTCTGSQVVQNTTTSGVQCITPTATGDGNNYTETVSVTGTTTKSINIGIIGRASINATFTDIDTDTDTWWLLTGSAYMSNCSGILCLNETKLNSTIISLTNSYWNYSSTISGIQANVSNVNSTANSKALPSTCTGNQAVQTTSSSSAGTCVGFGTGSSNLTLSDITSSIGNWSADKSAIQANITNVNATANLKALPGSCTGQVVSATTTSGVTCVDYLNTTTANTLYQTGTEQVNYTTSISFNVTGSNAQLNLQQTGTSNITATLLMNDTSRAMPSTCTGNQAVQTTSSTGSGTCATFGTGSSNLTLSDITSSIGNWSQDKSGIQANITNVNATANTKSMTGTASCTGTQVLQNVTLSSTGSPIANCTVPTVAGDGNNYTTSIGFNTTGSNVQLNIAINGRTNLTSVFIQNITGTGTEGKMCVWTGASTISTDSVYLNTTTNQMGINVTSASGLSSVLTVNGQVNITGTNSCIYVGTTRYCDGCTYYPNGGRVGSNCV